MIPLASTTVTVTRANGTGDPYEPASTSTVTAGAPAHISAPNGTSERVGGAQEVVDAVLYLPSVPALKPADSVVDALGDRYTVTWVRTRRGLGLDHQQAGLVAVRGGASG